MPIKGKTLFVPPHKEIFSPHQFSKEMPEKKESSVSRTNLHHARTFVKTIQEKKKSHLEDQDLSMRPMLMSNISSFNTSLVQDDQHTILTNKLSQIQENEQVFNKLSNIIGPQRQNSTAGSKANIHWKHITSSESLQSLTADEVNQINHHSRIFREDEKEVF